MLIRKNHPSPSLRYLTGPSNEKSKQTNCVDSFVDSELESTNVESVKQTHRTLSIIPHIACSQPRLLHRHRWRDAWTGAAQSQTRPAGWRLQEVRRVHRGAKDGQVAAAAGLHGWGNAGGVCRQSCTLLAGAKYPRGSVRTKVDVLKFIERQHDSLASHFRPFAPMCTQINVRMLAEEEWHKCPGQESSI